jgi:hypothetical protein
MSGNVKLYLSMLDHDDEVLSFETEDEAIAYASWWFLDGYMEEEYPGSVEDAVSHAGILVSTLKEGGEFIYKRFYEHVRIGSPTSVWTTPADE